MIICQVACGLECHCCFLMISLWWQEESLEECITQVPSLQVTSVSTEEHMPPALKNIQHIYSSIGLLASNNILCCTDTIIFFCMK